ncbi:MAG: hypothetical protein ABL967_02685 [Bryobacteraceae bacterium]
MTRLEDHFSKIAAQLPTDPETNLTLCATNCPVLPEELETDKLLVRASPLGRNYGDSARYDLFDFFADKPTYRSLGLMLFSSMFHGNDIVTLNLTHGETSVNKIVVKKQVSEAANPGVSELVMLPVSYGYWPEELKSRDPLHRSQRANHDDLPWMELTNEHLMCVSDAEFANRAVAHGFGNPMRTATLAALFLDIGLPGTTQTEFHLEGPSGNQSVAIGSAEARIWVGFDYAL